MGIAQPESPDDLAPHLLSGGRGAGHHRRRPQPLDHAAQPQVIRAEVVAPLGDAVGLVDGEEVHAALGQRVEELGRGEALG